MSDVVCFFMTQSNRARESLRRYSSVKKCSLPAGYHNATANIGDLDWFDKYGTTDESFPKDDPRWPSKCACGYEFTPEDSWQHSIEHLYKREDTGELLLRDEAPPGAMYDAWWQSGRATKKHPDGVTLAVILPPPNNAEWVVDGPSTSGGPGWSRTGTIPKVTASPSINAGDGPRNWHGWLRDGKLVRC